jgi:hypothetical protein
MDMYLDDDDDVAGSWEDNPITFRTRGYQEPWEQFLEENLMDCMFPDTAPLETVSWEALGEQEDEEDDRIYEEEMRRD